VLNISTPIDLFGNNMKDTSFIKFGSFYFHSSETKHHEGWDFLPGTATTSTKIIFCGANLSKEEFCQFKKPPDIRSKIMMGSNFVDL
jgi:hypothetical protein